MNRGKSAEKQTTLAAPDFSAPGAVRKTVMICLTLTASDQTPVAVCAVANANRQPGLDLLHCPLDGDAQEDQKDRYSAAGNAATLHKIVKCYCRQLNRFRLANRIRTGRIVAESPGTDTPNNWTCVGGPQTRRRARPAMAFWSLPA
jgi:hypothetical protein